MNIPQDWLYYVGSAVLAVISFPLMWSLEPFSLLIGIILFGSSFYLWFLGFQSTSPNKSQAKSNSLGSRTVNTSGGSYTEQHYGDYITIQDNRIYLGKNWTQLSNGIEEILELLKNKGYSKNAAEQQVIDELKTQILSNPQIRNKLLEWRQFLNQTTELSAEELESLIRIAESTTENTSYTSHHSTSVEIGNYQQLEFFLRVGAWKEADQEMVMVLLRLMPEENANFIRVDQIPPTDLKKINHLWVKYSNGKFGLSVQQRIWKRLSKVYQDKWGSIDNRAYLAFVDAVDWPREGDRIYYVNMNYSLNAPKGYLPAMLHFEDLWYSHSPSNYCLFRRCIFDDLMQREYSSFSLIPSWFRQWLHME